MVATCRHPTEVPTTRSIPRDSHRFPTRIATLLATWFVTRIATFPQFSTMFMRARFAASKRFLQNELRQPRSPLIWANCGKMWKSGGPKMPHEQARPDARLAALLFLLFPATIAAAEPKRMKYPLSRTEPLIEKIHGARLAAPNRWP